MAIEEVGDAIVVQFTRPEMRNSLSRDVVVRLHQIVEEVANCREVERLIFTGTGEAFASGANLNEIAALTADDAPEFARLGQSLMSKIAELPQFTIAAINGYCYGGALDLALACDVRVAVASANVAHPGAGLGIITGWGGTQRLPQLVGEAIAMEMFFTATPIDAERALGIGLTDAIIFDPVEAALRFVRPA